MRGRRGGQSSVEVMLVIGVIVIAIVAASFLFAGGNDGFIEAMRSLADSAATVYSTGPQGR